MKKKTAKDKIEENGKVIKNLQKKLVNIKSKIEDKLDEIQHLLKEEKKE